MVTIPLSAFWSLGNELQYDFDVMASMLKEMKEADTRHLYTTTSYTFERGHGAWPEPNDDFFITQKTKKGWIRGQGVFNQENKETIYALDPVEEWETCKIILI